MSEPAASSDELGAAAQPERLGPAVPWMLNTPVTATRTTLPPSALAEKDGLVSPTWPSGNLSLCDRCADVLIVHRLVALEPV